MLHLRILTEYFKANYVWHKRAQEACSLLKFGIFYSLSKMHAMALSGPVNYSLFLSNTILITETQSLFVNS